MVLNSQFSLRRQMFLMVFLAAACVFLSGCGEKRPKAHRIGILSGLSYMADVSRGFKVKMAELGYVEGVDVVYDERKTDFDMTAYKDVLRKFVADKVDLILVFPTEASLEAKAAIKGTDIPMVFAIANIEDTDLIESVRQPGGNITGVRYPGPDLALKRFEVMRELAPLAKRICIPYQRGYPIVESQLNAVRPTAMSAGVTLEEIPADNAAELQAIFEERSGSGDIGMDAILFISEPLTVTPDAFMVLAKFAAKHKLPIGGAYMMVEGYGTIFGVNVSTFATGKQAALLADKILRGTPAGVIPVMSSENFFQINFSVAQKLGVTVPEGLLSGADEVIR